MAFKDLFKNKPASTQMISTLTPQQQALQGQVIGGAGTALGNIGQNKINTLQPFNFAPIEQKAREGFAKQTIPSLAERFIGSGSGPRSSAFQGALGAAGSDLETNLAAMGAEYGFRGQQQQIENQFRGQELDQNRLNQLLHYGLQPSQNQMYTPGQPAPIKTFLGNLAGTVLPSAANLGLQALFGPAGVFARKAVGAGIGALTGGGTAITPSIAAGGTGAVSGPATGWLASHGIDASSAGTALGIGAPLAAGAALVAYIIKANQEGRKQEAAEAEAQLAKHEEFLKRQAADPNFGQLPASWPQPVPGEGLMSYFSKVLPIIQQERMAREEGAQ